MGDEIKLTHAMSETICQMEEVCFGEGIGPNNDVLMLWISNNYPDLKEKYSWLNWPKAQHIEQDNR
jgi:hypothetical protein